MSSGTDEQVGSTLRSTVVPTNTDKDEMEEVVDEEEDVEVEEELETDETEEEPGEVRDLLSTHSVWLRM